MFKFVTIYRRVDDEDAAEQFFSETHLPLTEKLPNLTESEVTRVAGKPGGESRFHMMYEAYFESREMMEAAFMTPEGRALLQALKPWADAKAITLFYGDVWTE